jgi:hypothetical protein
MAVFSATWMPLNPADFGSRLARSHAKVGSGQGIIGVSRLEMGSDLGLFA